ncbi:hypothetical protein CYMTET_41801 [Cymbomonas tetramitiformis]|uniref:Protein kinase domain-containing protein n=1 Tax=Cymbomonas tetramitiformis TaxID=36881 RepID=A0AAE0C5C6_9CHLO|nr:hypothetical protein CYMTET_41801 [Cymbomonas tetramitiformis]
MLSCCGWCSSDATDDFTNLQSAKANAGKDPVRSSKADKITVAERDPSGEGTEYPFQEHTQRCGADALPKVADVVEDPEHSGNKRLSLNAGTKVWRRESEIVNDLVLQKPFSTPFTKVRKLGSGSYGKVVLYQRDDDNSLHAVKVYNRSRLKKKRIGLGPSLWEDCLREVKILKRLSHPNIIELREVLNDEEAGKMYLILEYADGGMLRSPFAGKSGEPAELESYFEQRQDAHRRTVYELLQGIAYLHENGVVHGDIKPENILMTSEHHVKIADFGVSQFFEGADDRIRRSPGTPGYSAPECSVSDDYSGKAADMWALGITLYELFTGRHPFYRQGATVADGLEKIATWEFELPKHLGGGGLEDFLRGLLKKDPQERLSAEEALHHLWVTASNNPERGLS